MEVTKLTVGAFEENCYIVHDGVSGEGVIIDPGDEADRILALVKSLSLDIKYILGTHAHIDHVLGVEGVKAATGADYYLHESEVPLLEGVIDQAAMLGLPDVKNPPAIDGHLSEGDHFTVGNLTLRTLYTPGHSPGGVSFATDGAVFVGDALFAGSVGRVDLPGGSWEVLEASIRDKLFTLNDETIVYSGHGEETTIWKEKETNPFFRGDGLL